MSLRIYDSNSTFWIYKSFQDNIDKIKRYNMGQRTKMDIDPLYSDENRKNKIKTNKVFCFHQNKEIKKGDIIFIYNEKKVGKILKGFVKHYRVATDAKLNDSYNDIFKDTGLQKYFITFDIEYEYDEIFNMMKFKDYFHKDAPVTSPIMFSKLYLNHDPLTFNELPFQVGVFILNMILKRVKVKEIIKDNPKNKQDSKSDRESDNSESDNSESDNSDSESDNSESRSESRSQSDSESDNSDSDSDSEDNSKDDSIESNDQFKDNKKIKGAMIPVVIETCKKIRKDIKNLSGILFFKHYLECNICNSIDNNNCNLKYSYLKDKIKKVEFKIIKFDDVEDEYTAYTFMEIVSWNKKPTKSVYTVNYIKDSGSEYNNCVLINWFRVV
jgi:hypothetical protein